MDQLLGGIPFHIKNNTLNNVNIENILYIELTPCHFIYMNPALPTLIMILRCVSPAILVKLNQAVGICLCYGT